MAAKQDKVYGVILAAGRGERIKPLSFTVPKPLLPVCNKPIIQYQIEDMIGLGIRDFVIVVGHLGEKIENHFGDGSSLNVRIRYVEQKEKLGIAHAVGQLENYIDGPFLLFLGDIFILPKNLPRLFDLFFAHNVGAVLAVKRETDPRSIQKNFTVLLREGTDQVRRVIEKPRYLATNLKGCGVYLLSLAIFDAIRNTPRTAMRDEYEITTSIQILIDDGAPVFIADVVDWDMNVTVPCDLLRCNRKWLEHIGEKNVVDASASLPRGVKLENSVIGRNAVIRHPIAIRNSVILDDCKINSKSDIVDQLITPSFKVACPDQHG